MEAQRRGERMGSLSGVNRVENVEYVERGGDRGPRPTVGAAVPCRPHGFNRVENVEGVSYLSHLSYLSRLSRTRQFSRAGPTARARAQPLTRPGVVLLPVLACPCAKPLRRNGDGVAPERLCRRAVPGGRTADLRDRVGVRREDASAHGRGRGEVPVGGHGGRAVQSGGVGSLSGITE